MVKESAPPRDVLVHVVDQWPVWFGQASGLPSAIEVPADAPPPRRGPVDLLLSKGLWLAVVVLLWGGLAVGMVGVPLWAFHARPASAELFAVGVPLALAVMPLLFATIGYTYAVAKRAQRWRVAATSGGTPRSGR
ncbi:hypothetical protein [Umezawaea sp.]|uniref:hypothetical protein n=1 Tax=Umezawaea sp. TaxID=1955258 RepID=UPI002ED46F22